MLVSSPFTEQLKQLTDEERKLIEQLRHEVHDLVSKHLPLQHFCSEWTYVRYLRARSWNLQKASKMLRATLEWRLSFKPHEITWKDIQEEATTGKAWILDQPDKEGRPVVLMRPRKENTRNAEGQIKFLVYNLEHASHIADKKGVGKMVWLVDYEGYSMRNAPPAKTSLACLHLLQNHYPERLGQSLNFHAPALFSMSWKVISPFIDPVTHQKCVFIKKGGNSRGELSKWLDMSRMEECMAGDVKGEMFKLEEYSGGQVSLDEEIQKELLALQAAAEVGHSEKEGVGGQTATEALAVAVSS